MCCNNHRVLGHASAKTHHSPVGWDSFMSFPGVLFGVWWSVLDVRYLQTRRRCLLDTRWQPYHHRAGAFARVLGTYWCTCTTCTNSSFIVSRDVAENHGLFTLVFHIQNRSSCSPSGPNDDALMPLEVSHFHRCNTTAVRLPMYQ